MPNINENHNTSESQNRRIEKYLLAGNSLTGITALRLFGCFRLPSRICDLRAKRNLPIKSKYITLSNGKRVKEYSL